MCAMPVGHGLQRWTALRPFITQPLPIRLPTQCRESRTVVLALRGSHSMADAVTDLMDRPVDICDWLPEQFRQVLRLCCWAVF